MNIQKILENPRFRLETMEPAPTTVVSDFLEQAPDNLPVKYMHFMQASDGARGAVPYDSGYIEIWRLEETLDKQTGYGDDASLVGFFAFGTDGSGRDYLFDLRNRMVPLFIPSLTMNLMQNISNRLPVAFRSFLNTSR